MRVMEMDSQPEPNERPHEPLKCSQISPNVIAKWLAIFSQNYRQPIGEALPDIWLEVFRGIGIAKFEASCAKHLQTGKFFPTIADIHSNVEAPLKDLAILDAERAWDKVLGIGERWGIDEDRNEFIPIYTGGRMFLPPTLTVQEEYALRQIGWWQAIQRQEPEKISFLRRDFIATYKRYMETNGLKELPAGVAGIIRPQAQFTAGTFSSLKDILKSETR